jgi:protein-disulfide isomerase
VSGDRVMNVAVVVLTACALVTTGLVVRREFFPAQSASASAPTHVPAWREFARHGHRMGPAKAPVTVVVFSDFQCPYCGVLMDRLRALRGAHPGEVAVVYRHFPVEGHAHAVAAARASECAGAQGRFEAYHDALFERRDSIGVVAWDRFAATAGVPDLAGFRECAAASGRVEALSRDSAAARKLRVSGTPTLLINGLRLVGAPPMDSLESYLRTASAQARL